MPVLAENADIVYLVSYFDEPEDYIRNSIAQGTMQLPKLAAEYRRQLDAIAARKLTGPTGPGKPGTPTTPSTPTTPTSPGEPLKVTATETAPGTVTVEWTPRVEAAVARDGVDLDGDKDWRDTAIGSYAFARLKPGATYTFTVTAGTQSKTAKVTVGAPKPPAPPTSTTPPAEEFVTIRVPASWVTREAPRA